MKNDDDNSIDLKMWLVWTHDGVTCYDLLKIFSVSFVNLLQFEIGLGMWIRFEYIAAIYLWCTW